MSSMAQLRFSPLSTHHRHFSLPKPTPTPTPTRFPTSSLSFPSLSSNFSSFPSHLHFCFSIGGGGNRNHGGGHGGFGSGDDDDNTNNNSLHNLGILGLLIKGWQSRVTADPQFPFKVLMEEIVGVTACVIGDMATRPNFGLNELDFVFSTLVVGSILNFLLMYLLAPTSSSAAVSLPSIFAACPPSHMFEPGSFSLLHRCGTLAYKGAVFASVGFAAGLVGTAISNGLIMVRKRMDPSFETPNKPPPTLLNASTWALHMGVSSNLRYQTLNGIEFLLPKFVPPLVFKTLVVALRCGNNVLGGMSFVLLARLTGSQNSDAKPTPVLGEEMENEKLKLVANNQNEST